MPIRQIERAVEVDYREQLGVQCASEKEFKHRRIFQVRPPAKARGRLLSRHPFLTHSPFPPPCRSCDTPPPPADEVQQPRGDCAGA